MKFHLGILLSISTLLGFSQGQPQEVIAGDSITFTATVYLKNATKDGVYVAGYVVNIPYKELQTLDGKTIVISGVVSMQKGLTSLPENQNHRQGRDGDIGYLEKPVYRIVEE